MIDLLLSRRDFLLSHPENNDPDVRELQCYGHNRAENRFFLCPKVPRPDHFWKPWQKADKLLLRTGFPMNWPIARGCLPTDLLPFNDGKATRQVRDRTKSIPNKREIEDAKKKLDQFVAELKKHYPDYAAIRYPEPVAIKNVPLQDNEILLEYKVNAEATYLWKIEKGKKVSVIRIKGRKRKILSLRIHQYREPLENVNKLNAFNPRVGESLFKLLLQEALRNIDPNSHIIIVPDGPLNLLPFEALAVNAATVTKKVNPVTGIAGFTGIQYVGEQYKIKLLSFGIHYGDHEKTPDDPSSVEDRVCTGGPDL